MPGGQVPRPRELLSEGSEWAYWSRAAAPPDGWFNAGFDDSAWQRGDAQVGYGENDEATEVDYGDDEEAAIGGDSGVETDEQSSEPVDVDADPADE